jgi:hypothetical protein
MRDLVLWAEGKGVQMHGIKPTRVPARGVGVGATRELEVREPCSALSRSNKMGRHVSR